MTTPKVRLNNKTEIPQVGLGLWKVFLPWVAKKTVTTGLAAGYRHFDSAQLYHNEQYLGSALKESAVPRKDVFITTKIWNGNQPVNKLAPSFATSLKKLQTDYVDLLLLHFPVTETRRAAWPEMEKIYASGQARAIGVSNYMIPHLEELLKDCKVKPAVNQVELHLFLQQPELVAFCQSHDIVVEAYSPLAHGHGLDDPVLQEIAKTHGKTTAQIMLRWCIEVGTVPLPKSTNETRIKENLDIFDFKLTVDDMGKLKALDRNMRTSWNPSNVK